MLVSWAFQRSCAKVRLHCRPDPLPWLLSIRMTALSLKLLELQRNQLDHESQDMVQDQLQSPLFKLPPELRDVIWVYACAASDDMHKPYEPNSHYCRPGYSHVQRIDTAMLATCRKAYLECCHLPLALNEHVFWCYRGPRGEPAAPNRGHREQPGGPLYSTTYRKVRSIRTSPQDTMKIRILMKTIRLGTSNRSDIDTLPPQVNSSALHIGSSSNTG